MQNFRLFSKLTIQFKPLIAILQIVEKLVVLLIGASVFGNNDWSLKGCARIRNTRHHVIPLLALNEDYRAIPEKHVKALGRIVGKTILAVS